MSVPPDAARAVGDPPGTGRVRPRAVLIGASRISDIGQGRLGSKAMVLSKHLDATVIGLGRVGVRRVGLVRVVGLPGARSAIARRAIFLPMASLLGRAYARGGRHAGIVCQSPFEAFPVYLALRATPEDRRPALVIEVHGDWRASRRLYGRSRNGGPQRGVSVRLAEWVLRRGDRVRVISEATMDLVRSAGYRGPVDRYVTFSDFDRFLDTPPVAPPANSVALFAGSLEPVKGCDVLLDAWPMVRDRLPEARLLVAGKGRASARLRARAADLGMDRSVRFLGSVSTSGVQDLMDRSSVLVVPSRSEGLGRVVIEAMARGRPVVASKVGGIPELIVHGVTGLLVAPGDPTALAEALASVLADPDRASKMGGAGRGAAEERNPAAEYDEGLRRLAAWLMSR